MFGWMQSFKAFVTRGNVIDLAVGIIIGAAFTSIVNSLVEDLFNPVIGLLIGGVDFSNLFITIRGDTQPTLEAAKAAGAVTLNIGLFLNTIIKFLIVAFAVFWVVRVLTRINLRQDAEAATEEKLAAIPTASETLLSKILEELQRRPV